MANARIQPSDLASMPQMRSARPPRLDATGTLRREEVVGVAHEMLKPFQRRCLLASTTYSKGVDASLYYNPSCSKCRNAEALLANRGVEATVVRYLDDPPTPDELTRVAAKIGIEEPAIILP